MEVFADASRCARQGFYDRRAARQARAAWPILVCARGRQSTKRNEMKWRLAWNLTCPNLDYETPSLRYAARRVNKKN